MKKQEKPLKLNDSKKVYSVTELTRKIKNILEQNFSHVWVEGEVSNFLRHSSGHMYLSLKDENSALSCVFFRRENQKLKFEVENGMQVLALGRISVYEPRGQYQIYIESLEPQGLGALQLAFEQLKKKLDKEGLFDAARKKALPYLPQRIGVVTSPTGAAVRDIINVLSRRWPGIEILINPVKVQGAGSAEEIAQAIAEFNEYGKIDTMIVGRGGGSLEDLWAFNEEVVARAIAASEIPIISAVGHEIDFTISDFVADLRAPTPSAAAELVVPRRDELQNTIENYKTRISQALLSGVNSTRQFLDEALSKLSKNLRHTLELMNSRLKEVSGKLGALSPLSVLKRGFSITYKLADNKIIKTRKELVAGDKIKTRLASGEVISRVEESPDA